MRFLKTELIILFARVEKKQFLNGRHIILYSYSDGPVIVFASGIAGFVFSHRDLNIIFLFGLFLIWVRRIEFQYPRYTIVCFFYLRVFTFNITAPHFRSSCLSLSTQFHLPCSHYYVLQSFYPHCLTISVSLLLFLTKSYVCHTLYKRS